MEPITVTSQLTKSDFLWNQFYFWYRGFWIRFLAISVFVGIVCIFLFYTDNGYSNDNQVGISSSWWNLYVAWFFGTLTGLAFTYLIDFIFFWGQNLLTTTKHKKLLSQPFTLTFSDDGITSEIGTDRSVVSYDKIEKVFFYNRHTLLKPVGIPRFFNIVKWADVPENRRSDLKNLLTEKIMKAK